MKEKHNLTHQLLLGVFVLVCALLVVGCSDDANPVEPELNSPVVSETAGVTFAAKKPGSGATFTVEVFLDDGALTSVGSATDVKAKDSETRQSVGETTMTLNLNGLETGDLEDGCTSDFVLPPGGLVNGLFAISTAKIPKSSPTFTFVTADFFLFEVDGVTYGLTFGPDDDGEIAVDTNWLPTSPDSNFITGTKLKLRVTKGPQKKGPCNGIITQGWKILVTG